LVQSLILGKISTSILTFKLVNIIEYFGLDQQ